jgi:hypothetical protein
MVFIGYRCHVKSATGYVTRMLTLVYFPHPDQYSLHGCYQGLQDRLTPLLLSWVRRYRYWVKLRYRCLFNISRRFSVPPAQGDEYASPSQVLLTDLLSVYQLACEVESSLNRPWDDALRPGCSTNSPNIF